MFDSWWHHFLSNRNVAQLVAHYVRDVGVGRSSRLIPTRQRVAFWNTASYPLLFSSCRDEIGTAGLKFINLLYHEKQILHFDGNRPLPALFQLHKDSSDSF